MVLAGVERREEKIILELTMKDRADVDECLYR